jgi:hypothetical protein
VPQDGARRRHFSPAVSHVEPFLCHWWQAEQADDPAEGSEGAPNRCEHDRQAEQPDRQPDELEPIAYFERGVHAEDRYRQADGGEREPLRNARLDPTYIG